MTHRRRTRSLVVSTIAITLLGFGVGGLGAACGETRGSFGDACIKSEDCLSNICASQKCAADPTFLDGSPPPTEASVEAATDAPGEGGDGAAEAASDAGADG